MGNGAGIDRGLNRVVDKEENQHCEGGAERDWLMRCLLSETASKRLHTPGTLRL